jgi:hypothetical protein
MNVGLQKLFRIPRSEHMNVQFRAEAFNLQNRVNFSAPNGDRGSGSFGTIRSTYPARQLQFALRLAF